MKRYITLKNRPSIKDFAKSSGSPSSTKSMKNRTEKENEDMKKLESWNNL